MSDTMTTITASPADVMSAYSQFFLCLLVQVHGLWAASTGEYPDTLQSQLLVLSVIFDRLNQFLQRVPGILRRSGREEAFQWCIVNCEEAVDALVRVLNAYGGVLGDERHWNETAKSASIAFRKVIASFDPYHRASTM